MKGLTIEFETMVNKPSVFEPLKFYCILQVSDYATRSEILMSDYVKAMTSFGLDVTRNRSSWKIRINLKVLKAQSKHPWRVLVSDSCWWELTDHSSHCLPYNVYFQNARTLQSFSMVSSMVVIKLLVVCHVAVASNVVWGGLLLLLWELVAQPHCYCYFLSKENMFKLNWASKSD